MCVFLSAAFIFYRNTDSPGTMMYSLAPVVNIVLNHCCRDMLTDQLDMSRMFSSQHVISHFEDYYQLMRSQMTSAMMQYWMCC